MKMSVPKSMPREISIVGEISGEVLSHCPADSYINSAITPDDAIVSLEMTRNRGSDWRISILPPPHFLHSNLRARFNTHRSDVGAAV
jgi:hypothetical protein